MRCASAWLAWTRSSARPGRATSSSSTTSATCPRRTPDSTRPPTPQPFEGGEGRDQLVELGGGNLIPGFEEGLLGSAAGETRTIELKFPADYGAEHLAGRDASFEITVKEVKDKRLPEVDEDFAIDAGFDDVQELRADIRGRLIEAEEQKIEGEFREAALDAAVAQAQVPVTPALAEARAKEMWERMLHSLSHRGISREAYLQITGREEAEILAEMLPDAEQALRREAVLTAIVAAEGIVPSEEDLLEAMGPVAEREGVAAGEAAGGPEERGAAGGGARGSRRKTGRRARRRASEADLCGAGAGA